MSFEIPYGTLLTYVKKPTNDAERTAFMWRDLIKQDKAGEYDGKKTIASKFIARHLAEHLDETGLEEILDGQSLAIPIPGRAPRKRDDSLWVPQRFARALTDVGLCSDMWSCLKRIRAVPKSSYSAPGERPTIKMHFDSFAIDEDEVRLGDHGRIVLVDDFITKGATMLGAAKRVGEFFPHAEIVAFAPIRIVYNHVFKDLVDPTIGRVCEDRWGNAHRDP